MALTDDLEAFWELGNVNDAHGSNTLTNNGSTTFVSAKVGTGADFNGSSQYLSIADNASLSFDDEDMTIQAWVKFDDLSTTRVVAAKADSLTGSCEYAIYADSSANIRFRIGTDLGYVVATWSSTISTGTWYHVIAYVDATADVIGLVVNNGTAVTESTAGTSGVSDLAQAFSIGLDGPSAGRYMDGIVDQVGVWRRKLSGTEIGQLYNSFAGLAYSEMGGVVVDTSAKVTFEHA